MRMNAGTRRAIMNSEIRHFGNGPIGTLTREQLRHRVIDLRMHGRKVEAMHLVRDWMAAKKVKP